MRSQQTLIAGPVEGYKIVNEDMTCSPDGNTFKFEMGRNKLPNDKPLVLCDNGFHFCEHPSGPWAYYSAGRVFKVRAYGVLGTPLEPGADYKMVCEEIELYEEVFVGGDSNTGNSNTGDRNTGNSNTGDRNTGDSNTGDSNTGNRNTGNRNTGNSNTGNSNTGYRNTGDSNTGNRNTGDSNTGNSNTGNSNTGNSNTGDSNTGDWNTGDSNCGDFHTGALNHGEAPMYLFNKIAKISRDDIPWSLVYELGELMKQDKAIDPTPFLDIPNSTPARIKALHMAFIAARAATK